MSDSQAALDHLSDQQKASNREYWMRQLGSTGGPASGGIHAAMSSIMAEVGGVGKERRNEGQRYNFRGIADIYLACQRVMAKHGVHLVPHRMDVQEAVERETAKGGKMMHVRLAVCYRFYCSDGSFEECCTVGEAMDSGDKASNKAMSAAAKYALVQAFSIPEEDPDVDTENSSPELAARAPAPPAQPPADVKKAAPDAALLDRVRSAITKLEWKEAEVVKWLTGNYGNARLSKLSNADLEKAANDAEALLADQAKREAS